MKWLKKILIFFKEKKSIHNYIKVVKSCEDKQKIELLRFKFTTKIIRSEFETKKR